MAFYAPLRRDASAKALHIVYSTLSSDNIQDNDNIVDLIALIEKATPPLKGLEEQNFLIAKKFGKRAVGRAEIVDMSKALRWACEPPPYKYDLFWTRCPRCLGRVRHLCRACRVVGYCSPECQRM